MAFAHRPALVLLSGVAFCMHGSRPENLRARFSQKVDRGMDVIGAVRMRTVVFLGKSQNRPCAIPHNGRCYCQERTQSADACKSWRALYGVLRDTATYSWLLETPQQSPSRHLDDDPLTEMAHVGPSVETRAQCGLFPDIYEPTVWLVFLTTPLSSTSFLFCSSSLFLSSSSEQVSLAGLVSPQPPTS